MTTTTLPTPDAPELLTFLGTGAYTEVPYFDATGEPSDPSEAPDAPVIRTRFIQAALAALHRPSRITVLCTDAAWTKHGDALTAELTALGAPTPEHIRIGGGGSHDDLWSLFSTTAELLERHDTPLLLDITHGFRVQPFFAASALTLLRALDGRRPIRIVYGAFEAKDAHEGRAPIWDVTATLDVVEWSIAAGRFLGSGRAADLARPTKQLGRELSKRWAQSGRLGDPPELQRLGKALIQFGNDLDALRIGKLLLGPDCSGGSAHQLYRAIEAARADVERHLPVLHQVLERIADRIRPLTVNVRDGAADHLGSPTGLQALAALARAYLDWGRVAECIVVLREGHTCTVAAPKPAARAKATSTPTRAMPPTRRSASRWAATAP